MLKNPAGMGDLEQALAETLRAVLPMLIEKERGRLHRAVVTQLERPLFAAVLSASGGNQLEAARILGINRNTLRKRLRLLGLSEPRVLPKFQAGAQSLATPASVP